MKMLLLVLAAAGAALAGDWTKPVEVRHETTLCVTYRAKLSGGYLVIEAAHSKPWHTYAIDNKVRAAEKLAGKKSLGIDQPTAITVSGGLEVAGGWLQTPPKDLSKPELRWFTWGFEGQSLFAAKVRKTGPGPAKIGLRGQACTEANCKNIDAEIELPLSGMAGALDVDLKALIPAK
ncbi:MAG: hypothetical protein SFV51_05460 [Bryobacteraceae bacterium]|nr:hypothetical protein [Bryobacteraceae bacterium]